MASKTRHLSAPKRSHGRAGMKRKAKRRSAPKIVGKEPRRVRARDVINQRTIIGYATPGPMPGLVFLRRQGHLVRQIFERRKLVVEAMKPYKARG